MTKEQKKNLLEIALRIYIRRTTALGLDHTGDFPATESRKRQVVLDSINEAYLFAETFECHDWKDRYKK
jgi:hypothetical protein